MKEEKLKPAQPYTRDIASPTTTSGQRTARKKPERAAKKPTEFVLRMPQARCAAVAGTFNNWDPSRTPMQRDGDGALWKTSVELGPGQYEYRFVVDNAQWLTDPEAKETVGNNFGSTNSIVRVSK
jgi:1,4-alpha-glucan branching enzyme